jgi:transposase-like protein
MQHYSQARKKTVLKKMMPPSNMSIAKLSLDMGISQATLYYWRKQAMNKGRVMQVMEKMRKHGPPRISLQLYWKRLR